MAQENLPVQISQPGFLRQNFPVLLFVSLGLIFFILGLFSLRQEKDSKDSEVIFETKNEEVRTMKVDVEGAVVHPGVYEMTGNARVQEALILAGGLSSLADREWVAKNLNLAAKLSDGAKIYIPQKGESPLRQSFVGQAGIRGESLGEKININTATTEELDKLPGVGPVTAQKILAGRPYQTVEDLLAKKIVGASVFSQIREQVTVW